MELSIFVPLLLLISQGYSQTLKIPEYAPAGIPSAPILRRANQGAFLGYALVGGSTCMLKTLTLNISKSYSL
jgi:hypothetical protein